MSEHPGSTGQPAAEASPRTHVRVVRGAPDDLELAALVAGLATAGADEPPSHTTTAPAAWSDRGRLLRRPGQLGDPGPDTWRWSLRG
ncbi:acyl-CoA carboxylase subunit epsilon [Cellulomonas fimi]|uniref:Acyl-CoA carboxylase subunit epsilon n=1 Tax=Cellulomonas fimi TaxID=1708 RepID=A0A7Y0QH84_CELFI|nr:acyl-CoA carboxylase subunit epsilon [Cellulomonas fimi]NMR19923.1 acyl-CoA carboxylase subunit epsilon [Cellulomonas fimi]